MVIDVLGIFSIIETWSVTTFMTPDLESFQVTYLGTILLDFTLLAAWAALYYGINYFLLLEDQIDQPRAARKPGVERPAGDASLPTQPALPVQHAQLDLDPGAA